MNENNFEHQANSRTNRSANESESAAIPTGQAPQPPAGYAAAHHTAQWASGENDGFNRAFAGTATPSGAEHSATATAPYGNPGYSATAAPDPSLPSKAKKQLVALTCSLSLVCGILGGVAGGALSNAAGGSQTGGMQQQGQMQAPGGQDGSGASQAMPGGNGSAPGSGGSGSDAAAGSTEQSGTANAQDASPNASSGTANSSGNASGSSSSNASSNSASNTASNAIAGSNVEAQTI